MNKLRTRTDSFGKNESTILAGIAILLMIWHHLFCFKTWLLPNVRWESSLGYFGTMTAGVIARFGDICVPIYAFISGYALYRSSDSYLALTKRCKRLLKFLINYWIICIAFLMYGVITEDNVPSVSILILNLFGINLDPDSPYINVPFAWYVAYYILFIFLSPIIYKFFSGGKKKDMIVVGIALLLLYIICAISSLCHLKLSFYLSPLFATLLGFLSAKYDLFSVLNKWHKSKNYILVYILILTALPVIRYVILSFCVKFGCHFDFIRHVLSGIIAVVLIACVIEIMQISPNNFTSKIFSFLGGISMYLWYIHGIFFTGKKAIQNLIYSFEEPIVIFIICLSVVTPLSFCASKIGKVATSRIR